MEEGGGFGEIGDIDGGGAGDGIEDGCVISDLGDLGDGALEDSNQ